MKEMCIIGRNGHRDQIQSMNSKSSVSFFPTYLASFPVLTGVIPVRPAFRVASCDGHRSERLEQAQDDRASQPFRACRTQIHRNFVRLHPRFEGRVILLSLLTVHSNGRSSGKSAPRSLNLWPVTCVLIEHSDFRHEFEWKREECFLIRKPDPPVLVAITREPPGKIKTKFVQLLDYNLKRCVASPPSNASTPNLILRA